LGSPWVALAACFQTSVSDWLTRRPLVRTGTNQVHSLTRPLLLRVPSARRLLASFDASLACQDFCPLSTSLHGVHTREGFQVLASFRPQVLSTSRRFTPLCNSRVCFIPQPSAGLFSVRGFVHPAQRSALFELLCPLAVSSRRLTRKRVASLPSLDLEAFLHAGPRIVRLVFSRPLGRSLHRILGSPRCSQRRGSRFPQLPALMAFSPSRPSCSQASSLVRTVAPPAH
jgi:hypothetical protein